MRMIDRAIDWAKYPYLREWFEHRPRINVYWQELARFVEDHAAPPSPVAEPGAEEATCCCTSGGEARCGFPADGPDGLCHLCRVQKHMQPAPPPTVPPGSEAGQGEVYQEEPGRDYRKERDAAYTERNRLVAALARLIVAGGGRAWLADHPEDPTWDPEWRTVVFIEGPTGQLSWHLHDSDVPLFEELPRYANTWDGHSTAEKYERLAKLAAPTDIVAPEASMSAPSENPSRKNAPAVDSGATRRSAPPPEVPPAGETCACDDKTPCAYHSTRSWSQPAPTPGVPAVCGTCGGSGMTGSSSGVDAFPCDDCGRGHP